MESSPNGDPTIGLRETNGLKKVKELKDLKEYAIPIAKREPRSREQRIRGYLFVVALLTAMIMLHALQLMCLPLLVHPKTRGVYKRGIRYTKASFGVFMGEFWLLPIVYNRVLYLFCFILRLPTALSSPSHCLPCLRVARRL